MTVEEFGILADAIKTYFPRDNVLPNKQAIEMWFDMLKDLDYQSASYGLKKYVSLNKFPPAISDIRECAASIREPEELNEMEAWALVRNAISNGIYHSVEEFEKLPPLVQKAVGLPDQLRIWAMDEDYSEAVTSSNFIKTYRVICDRQEENKKIPANVRKLIEKTYKGSYPAQIEQKRQDITKSSKTNQKAIETKQKTSGMQRETYERWMSLKEELSR